MRHPRIMLRGLGLLNGLHWETAHLLRIGRHRDNDIILEDALLGPHHAQVFHGPRGWMVRDLGNVSGTFVNGARLSAAARVLNPMDVLCFADLALVVAELQDGRPALLETESGCVRLEAAARRSWQEALEVLAARKESQHGQGRAFLDLLGAGYYLWLITSPDQVLQPFLDDTVAALAAQRGAILLKNAETGELAVRAVTRRPPSLNPAVACSHTLAERAFSQGESLLCCNADADAALQSAHSIRRGSMASVICALLRTPRQRLGVLHLDRGPAQPPFTEDDLSLVDAVAASASVGIEAATLVESERAQAAHVVGTLAQAVDLRCCYD
jgi:GAF domain-containing protein